MNPQAPNNTRGYIIAFISAIILSTTAIFIGYLYNTYHIPALILAFWRNAAVVLTLLIVYGIFARHLLKAHRKDFPFLGLHGIILVIFNILWTLSVVMNGAAVATVLVYSSAAFTAILGWLFLKESLGWVKILVILVCFGGCVLTSGAWQAANWQSNPLGIVIGLSSGMSYAAYNLMGRTASKRGINPWTGLLYTFGLAGICLLILNLLPVKIITGTAATPLDFFWLGTAWQGWLVLFLLGAIPTVLGFGLLNVSLTLLPSSTVSLIVTSEPVFTTITAFFLLKENMDVYEIIGGALIIAGVICLRVYESRSKPKPE